MQAIILLLCLMVSGCATTGGYKNLIDSWVGQSEIDLVNSWGPPDSQYQANTHERILTYNHRGQPLFGGNNVELWCKTHFYLTDGIIKGGKWDGNSCRK